MGGATFIGGENMSRYVLKRLGWLILTTLVVAILIFTIMYFVPGDPGRLILGNTATEEEIYNYDEQLGLHDPFIVQLGRYMSDTFLHLDLGTSYIFKVPVVSEFASRLPRTLILGLLCMVISAVIGIPLGILCALKRNSILDHGAMVIAMLGVSVPQFWLALMMVILFSLKLGWLPPYGFGGIEYWVMPVIAGSVGGIAMNARQTRSAVLETIRADFVTTARAKGVHEQSVIYKHMLPNAMIPIINLLGGTFAMAIGGTVVIESVFQFPGVGYYMLQGITQRDYPVVRSCILILAIFSTLAMLIVDLVYAYLDPRIKAQYVNSSAKRVKKKEVA
jgi:peptide/nickel transport system permease protein